MRGTVLVVDDRARPRRALATELEDAGFAVVQASDGVEAWERFCQHAPDVVITDMVMPRSDGLDLLSRIRSRSDVPVILFTARGTVQTAATAFKAGADDFVSSPDVEVEDLVALVRNAISGARPSQGLPDLGDRLVGSSRAMSRLRERISGLAPLHTPVLVSGEPGTGRDTVVRALHELGATAGGKLIRVDAGSFSPDRGVRECTAVYLDGIEQFSAEAQSFWAERLDRAEAEGFRCDPRILASTSDPLNSHLHGEDAYQKLRAALIRFALELPPLRTLRDDLPDIADALTKRIGGAVGRKIRLSASTREFLATQRWPGNFRQLEQLLERAVAFSRGQQIRRQLVEELLVEVEDNLASIRGQHAALERDALLRALQQTGGNVTQSAEILGKSRAAVYRLLEKHGLALSRDPREQRE
jgi:DNA-binding NtrC family response regulator